ncbi:DNA glycosylase [Metschnikowia bicuspidata]|uniref:DNA glycosylase n=1 Tax=Metschnikowia bicuspidata TaxID=27322 RepID=A0A4P9Z9C7_9ASCO|nr:DNA glycosylase [Metschnikowia bicuspidata]
MARTRSAALLPAKTTAAIVLGTGARARVNTTEKVKKVVKKQRKAAVADTEPTSEGTPALEAGPQDAFTAVPSASARKTKPHIESFFAHIATPPDLRLPTEFLEFHTPEFIRGVEHVLSVDASLYPAVVHDNFRSFERVADAPRDGASLINHYWFSLITSVLSQQISGHAAKAIRTRFELLFADIPTPEATLKLLSETLKAVGLSTMKLKYVLHISETFARGDSALSQPEFYQNASTQELIKELTQLKGVGEWSARMFCLFTLKNMDVFAHDDLGVARGIARYFEVRPEILAETKQGVHVDEQRKAGLRKKTKFAVTGSKRDWTPLHDEYVKFLAQKLLPYRLVFMLVMWRLSATNTEVLQK